MNGSQLKETYLTPDPAWDYYEVWSTLLQAKAQIDQALEKLKTQEEANSECDLEVYQDIVETVQILESIDLDVDED